MFCSFFWCSCWAFNYLSTGPTGPAGTITPGPAVADLAATATLAEVIGTVNTLLASLRAAGVIAT